MIVRTALAALFVMTGMAMAAPAPDPSAAEPGHVVGPAEDAKGAVTRQQFEARFETSAAEFLASHAGVRADRFAAFDIGSSWGRCRRTSPSYRFPRRISSVLTAAK